MSLMIVAVVGGVLLLALVAVVVFLMQGSNSGKTPRELELEQRVRALESKSHKGHSGGAGSWQDDQDVRALALAGEQIKAIKLVRERYGMGLKEAKDCVDTIRG
jgi:ribosomal protein L7/L12